MTDIVDKVCIRRMDENDLDQVVEIEKRCFCDPWSERAFRDALHDKSQVYFCLIIDNEIAGYCGIMTVLDEGQILNVAVDTKYRRRGLGQYLLNEVFKYGDENKLSLYTLEVRESNTPARELYKKMGFVETGVRPRYYVDPVETAILMDLNR